MNPNGNVEEEGVKSYIEYEQAEEGEKGLMWTDVEEALKAMEGVKA